MQFVYADSPLNAVAVDILVVIVPQGGTVSDLDGEFGSALRKHLGDEEFCGKAGQHVALPTLGQIAAKRVLVLGAGVGDSAALALAAGMAGTEARKRGALTVGLALGALTSPDLRSAIEAFAEGNYRFDKYKPANARKAAATTVTLHGAAHDDRALSLAKACIAGQNLARDLVNEQPAECYPQSLAAVAEALANDCISVTVLDEVAIRERGMGGITGVGQGSVRPPRFVHARYEPKRAAKAHVALIGKGVTFDSGGLSLKPTDGMLTMRCDMAGAAAVIGTLKAVSAIAPDVRVDVIFGAVENMPSGNSYKLGDILKMYNGKTVEIHNTDAEGRLVLADCLSYASDLKPDAIIDLATLTGAAVIALGDWYSALYTRSDALHGELVSATTSAHEAVWRMPLPDLYKDKLKAEWGELKNVGGRAGGSITAALFLSEFVTVSKWAHIDIAGPAFMDSPLMHYTTGGTGTMVRSLTRWIESLGR